MKSRTILPSFLSLAALSLILSGCAGYQLGPQKPVEYADISKLYVPTFSNETLEPRLATIVTNSVISLLQQDGTYEITTKEKADAELTGRIRRIEKQQQRSANNQLLRTRELLLQLEVAFDLQDLRTGEKIKRANPFGVDADDRDIVTGRRRASNRVVGSTSLFLDPNFQLSEREALPLAAEDAAEQLVSAITEGW
tara:strand:+ start:33704 stop:34291 length:588 start_codon:yes stop_codon:yes gene_type:complete